MGTVGGPLVVIAIAVVALIALFAVLHFGFHAFGRRKGRSRPKSAVMSDSRIEVLESTPIDHERRLVLIRCDRTEHLVIVGGPTDLVIENDVRKVRGPGAPPAKIPGMEPEKPALPAIPQRTASIPSIDAAAPIAPAPKPPEPQRTTPRATLETRPAPPAQRAIAPLQPPSVRPVGRNGEASVPVPPMRTEESRGPAPAARPQPGDPKTVMREAPPARRLPPAPPASRPEPPLRAAPPAPANDRAQRGTKPIGRVEPSPALPTAHTPWVEPDSIETEIVRALNIEPQVRAGQVVVPPPAQTMNSSTTLGDLADRLEEALAREVQGSSQSRPGLDAIDFGFESETPAAEPTARVNPTPQKEKRERGDPPRVAAVAPSPDADAKRDQPAPVERREEAPVISLNARRRESADQLEDEMARLLGELTGDTKSR